MGEWDYSLGEPISWDEGYFVPRYPRHVAQAFIEVSYDDAKIPEEEALHTPYQQFIEKDIQRFAERWGGLGDAAFLRALQEAQGRDRLVAIFALGHNSLLSEATDLLAPFLSSPDQLERCAAACMFALRRDERALPVLEEYLLHEPPKDEQDRYLPESEVWYASERCRIARLLATWGPPSVIPVLRQAFLHLWRLESEEGGNVYDQETQDALCYALGRRGALSAFHGIELPAQRRRIASMYLALGYVQADERFERLYDAILLDHGLEQELIQVFMEQFALSEEESRETIHSYPTDTEQRRYATYGIGEYDETPIIVKLATPSEEQSGRERDISDNNNK